MKKISLSQEGKKYKGQYVALVDDEDFERINKYPWFVINVRAKIQYAAHGNKEKYKLMHREVMHTPKEMETDHINGDGLDNRRKNLRICTHSENQQNQRVHREGGLVGVSKIKHGKKVYYQAQVNCKGKEKRKYLGLFPTAELAHQAWLKARMFT